jgi:phosphoribosylformylglycinamidine synthase
VTTRVAILRFPGTWSERDFQHAFSLVPGVETEVLWHAEANLRGYDAAIVPGGFSYGDYLRCGAIAKISPAATELKRAAAEGMPILGSCNGFQILCEIGLLPGALVRNDHLEFRCDWVRMRVENESAWTKGMAGQFLRMPIAHGEGNWVADERTVAEVEERGQVVFRYVDEQGLARAEASPNGAIRNIAGIVNPGLNVVGLMPHPERCAELLIGGHDGMAVLRAVA